MTTPSKINGNYHYFAPTPEQKEKAEEVAILEANVAYIERMEEICGGDFRKMMSSAMSVTTMMLSSAFNGNQQRVADVYRASSAKFADLIESSIVPDDRVVN